MNCARNSSARLNVTRMFMVAKSPLTPHNRIRNANLGASAPACATRPSARNWNVWKRNCAATLPDPGPRQRVVARPARARSIFTVRPKVKWNYTNFIRPLKRSEAAFFPAFCRFSPAFTRFSGYFPAGTSHRAHHARVRKIAVGLSQMHRLPTFSGIIPPP